MSRCTKCNGKFIQKPLTTEEAVEAAKGFQVIPNCLFNKNLEFWQCLDCNQLYWEVFFFLNAFFGFHLMFPARGRSPSFLFYSLFHLCQDLLHNFEAINLQSSDSMEVLCVSATVDSIPAFS